MDPLSAPEAEWKEYFKERGVLKGVPGAFMWSNRWEIRTRFKMWRSLMTYLMAFGSEKGRTETGDKSKNRAIQV